MKNATKWRLEQFRGWLVDNVKLLWLYPLMGFVLAVSLSWAFGRNALGSVVSVQEQSGTGPYSLPCVLTPAPKVALRCMRFEEHLYAVANVNLQTEEIVFTTSDDKRMETFSEVVRNLSNAGVKPILVTNAGIYGTDNRPLGLLISPKGKLHNVNAAAGSAREQYRAAVEDTIRRFEPRFKMVKVTLVAENPADRSLRFHIDALMYAEPAPERVSFDSLLDPSSQSFSVVGGA